MTWQIYAYVLNGLTLRQASDCATFGVLHLSSLAWTRPDCSCKMPDDRSGSLHAMPHGPSQHAHLIIIKICCSTHLMFV